MVRSPACDGLVIDSLTAALRSERRGFGSFFNLMKKPIGEAVAQMRGSASLLGDHRAVAWSWSVIKPLKTVGKRLRGLTMTATSAPFLVASERSWI
ncbi:MAG TPA: hypothetical protein PKJ00_03380 [Verrucomicrobiota bacterium]|nr:hypothetical protein [Verrucomicrobiota bacterium]HNS69012.1 hypothetical protein [Verrucomicrobiota bacterium]